MKNKTARSTQSRRLAYSMVELMVSTALLGIIMASIVGTFMAFASGSKGVAAYTEMSQQSRRALELFSRDIRAAQDVVSATQFDLVVEIPEDTFYQGGTVQYTFDEDVGIFSRIVRDKANAVVTNQIVLDGVEQFTYSFFDPLGHSLDYAKKSLLLSIKSVQVSAEMVRPVSRTEATDYIISARFMMRNRALTE